MLNSYGPEDKDALYKRYIKNYKKGRMLIAGFLSSFVWFLLIFLSIVFMISDFDTQNINETLVVGILIGGIVLFVGRRYLLLDFLLSCQPED